MLLDRINKSGLLAICASSPIRCRSCLDSCTASQRSDLLEFAATQKSPLLGDAFNHTLQTRSLHNNVGSRSNSWCTTDFHCFWRNVGLLGSFPGLTLVLPRLVGINLLQTYSYFRTYTADSMILKILVSCFHWFSGHVSLCNRQELSGMYCSLN